MQWVSFQFAIRSNCNGQEIGLVKTTFCQLKDCQLQPTFATMKESGKGVVLYGVLNWGLGHATRSVSIIKALRQNGFQVVIASDGQALKYLREVFPDVEIHELPGYNIKYGKGSAQLFKLALQLPRLALVSRKEKVILKKLIKRYKPCGVISDNRLGWNSHKVPSVYITHQLHIMMPFNTNWASRLHHIFINRFTECWVPDFAGQHNLSGELTHKLSPKVPVQFISPQSQFMDGEANSAGAKKYHLSVILSGPEPQRTLLEKKLWQEIKSREGRFLFIRGTENGKSLTPTDNIEVIEIANAERIKTAILASQMVISRSGYSSIMDYYFLGNQALLIPTPGQPEQEYLARYQLHKGRFGYTAQDYINLDEDVAKAKEYRGFERMENSPTDWENLFGLFEGKRKGGT